MSSGRRYLRDRSGFSLIEVVVALGVVAFAIVAILGLVPTGLQTSRNSQNDSRAAQIAQAVFASLASQAPRQFSNISLPLDDNSPVSFDLSQSETKSFYADNDGKLVGTVASAAYEITAATNKSPTGFDQGYANQVTLTVAWPPAANPTTQTKRDFVRIISKY